MVSFSTRPISKLGMLVAALALLSACNSENAIKNEQMTKERLLLMNTVLDIFDATDETSFIEAMSDSSNSYELISRWEGIDKAQKQKIWFIKEDLDKKTKECENQSNEPSCGYPEDLKNLKRSVDTYIKAFDMLEGGSVQEFNQLTGVSNEFAWKALNNLVADKQSVITPEQIEKFIIRYINIQFTDDIQRMEICNKVSGQFHDYARYESYCNYDFQKSIRAMSNEINDLNMDNDNPSFNILGTICITESELRNSESEKMPELCPITAKKMNDVKWEHDLYLSGLKKEKP